MIGNVEELNFMVSSSDFIFSFLACSICCKERGAGLAMLATIGKKLAKNWLLYNFLNKYYGEWPLCYTFHLATTSFHQILFGNNAT